ncbi:hypothetical protein SARC_14308, partial [Sphaeroforma arctica JP610]
MGGIRDAIKTGCGYYELCLLSDEQRALATILRHSSWDQKIGSIEDSEGTQRICSSNKYKWSW